MDIKNKKNMINIIEEKAIDYEKLSDAGVAYMAGYMEGLIRGRSTDNNHSPAA